MAAATQHVFEADKATGDAAAGAASSSSSAPDAAKVAAAAAAVRDADFLYIGAGAGLSADSGLAVFSQVNDMAVLQRLGLSYDTVASVDMLRKDPALFLGFYRSSHAAYSGAKVHEGYSILRRWATSPKRAQAAKRLAAALSGATGDDNAADDDHDPWEVEASWCVTSNVDGFFERAGFRPGSIGEIHGSARRWQCGGVPNHGAPFPAFKREKCGDDLFAMPDTWTAATVDEDLRAQPPAGTPKESWPPRCPNCKEGVARPNVYLFGDGNRFAAAESVTHARRERAWREAVLKLVRGADNATSEAEAEAGAEQPLRLLIIEIGCGLRVPSIRRRCEELFLEAKGGAGGSRKEVAVEVQFLRINPEYELNELIPGATPTLPIRAGALDTLQAIDAALQALPQGT